MFLNVFGLRNPNAVLSDFKIYFGSLLCPLFNEHGLIRVWTDHWRDAAYASSSQTAKLAHLDRASKASDVG